MTEKQKAEFLKSEGWKKHLQGSGIYWGDPVPPNGDPAWVQMCPFDEAYRIASRRKRQREWRRLKEAGFRRCNEGRYHFRSSAKCMTRQEALQTLEKQP